MSFQDIFKNSFLDTTSTISIGDMAGTLLLSFIIGFFIYQIYKKSYQSVVYTKSFSVSLILMTMVTSLVILAVTANVVLSLGMVGALSIVRFRAAIKDPMDIVFMFWAIAVGIVVGAGFYLLGLVGSVVIGIVMILLNFNVSSKRPYLLVLQTNDAKSEAQAMTLIKTSVGKVAIKSKSVTKAGIELMIEIRLDDGETSIVNKLMTIEDVVNATLVSHSEYSV